MPLITKVLKPEEFNSTVLAKLYWEAGRSMQLFVIAAEPWEKLEKWFQQEAIDQFQHVLDALSATGVIG